MGTNITGAMALTLALYLKTNGIDRRNYRWTESAISKAIREMQEVTETMDCQIQSEQGLLEMSITYSLDKEAWGKYQSEQVADYNSIYK